MSRSSTFNPPDAASVDAAEIGHFDALSSRWWDEGGPFAALQAMTPARVRYIRQHCARLLNRPIGAPLDGVSVLDIGCGGGLLAEPLARLGAVVTGIDASSGAIAAATDHAARSGVKVTYSHTSAEELAKTADGFDVIIASEVIEHVQDRQQFLSTVASLGHKKAPSMVVITTINRSLAGVALGKYAAEYLLCLVPRGTHDAGKFVKPSELKVEADTAGIDIDDITGIRPRLCSGSFFGGSFFGHSVFGGFTLGGPPVVNYAASGLVRR
jgi:2-polyprenyl-6-hydroxyphenyl methylase/3-demethylubiquinone-9 3-methyltransferase